MFLVGLSSCSAPGPAKDDTVHAPTPGPAGDKSAVVYFEGNVDVQAGTMTVAIRSPTGELRPASNPTLPSGQASGDVFFHTCTGTVGFTAGVLSGTVQAVNLSLAPTIDSMTAVIDSVSATGVTYANPIATYSVVGINAASNCGTPSATWTFNDPSGTSFSFTGHAEGLAVKPLAWLVASDITAANGAGVATWPDRSGNNNNGTATNGTPTFVTNAFNGLPALNFSGAPYYRLPNAALPAGNSSYTMLVVAATSQTTRGGLLCGGVAGGPSTANCFRITGGGDPGSTQPYGLLNYWWGPDLYATGNNLFAANATFVAATRYNAATPVRQIWLNGSLRGSDSAANENVPAGPLFVGNTFINEFLTGKIAEVIVYNSALSNADLAAVFTYLQTKYNAH